MYSGPHPLMGAAKLNTMERLYYLRNFQTLLEKVANKHFFLESTRNQKHKIFFKSAEGKKFVETGIKLILNT